MVGETRAAEKERSGATARATRAALGALVVCAACQSARDPGRSAMDEGVEIVAGAAAADAALASHAWGRWLVVPPEPSVAEQLAAAAALERAGSAEEAIELLADVVEEQASASALEARGALYAALGFPRAAAGDFQRACGVAPERSEAWFALGRTYQQLDLPHQALDALGRAASMGQSGPALELAFARSFRDLGRRGRSAQHYARLFELEPDPGEELFIEAARLASPPGALSESALSRALGWAERQGAGAEHVWLVRSLLAEGEGESPAALAAYLRASEIDGAALCAWTRIALLALELGDPETAADAERLAAGG